MTSELTSFFGDGYLRSIADYDLIFKSPGIPPFLPELVDARDRGRISSNAGLFFEACSSTVIGITGTKGKIRRKELIILRNMDLIR